MKKYYLVAEKSPVNGGYRVRVADNPIGMEILKEFEAPSYSEAVKMFSFSVRNQGKAAFCGVSADGTPYHGEA